MPDGELAVKQVRPFLLTEPPSTAPVFRIDVPAGTEACGVFRKRSTSRGVRDEFELKTVIRFRPGQHDLPGSLSTFTVDLIDEVLFGPSREVLVPIGPGTVHRAVFPIGEESLYKFDFNQSFATSDDRRVMIEIMPTTFTVTPGAPLPGPLVLTDAILTNSFVPGAVPDLVENRGSVPTLSGEVQIDGARIHDLRFSSCDLELLPLWAIKAEVADGNFLRVEWRYRLREPQHEIGPAAQMYARFDFGDQSREVFNYWNNVYSARRHNNAIEQWVVLDPPVQLDGIEEAVHAVELVSPQEPLPPDILERVEPKVHYLNETLERIATLDTTYSETESADSQHPGELFRRGDANGDAAIDITDAISILQASFLGRPFIPCRDAADLNDDSAVDITDPLLALEYLFLGTFVPASPGPIDCGPDPLGDGLGCLSYPPCD